MISFRSSTTLPLFGLLIALAGCSGQTGAASAVDSTAAAQTTKNTADNVHPSPAAFHRPPHGPEHLLVAALHEPINLTAEQKTAIEGALAEAAPKGLPAFDRTRVVALAAAVRAGKVDPASLPAAPGALDDAVNARRAASAKALDMLHATLTKEQRRALVDAVSKRATEHGSPPDRDGAKAPPHMERREGHHGGPMGGLLEGLDLTKAQEDAMHAKFEAQKPSDAEREAMKKQFETMRTEMHARLQTFVNDSFDANAFVAPPSGAAAAPKHVDRMVNDLAIITSVLDQAQREKLAARIEQGPPARGRGGPPEGRDHHRGR